MARNAETRICSRYVAPVNECRLGMQLLLVPPTCHVEQSRDISNCYSKRFLDFARNERNGTIQLCRSCISPAQKNRDAVFIRAPVSYNYLTIFIALMGLRPRSRRSADRSIQRHQG